MRLVVSDEKKGHLMDWRSIHGTEELRSCGSASSDSERRPAGEYSP
jgi:hypothetical protein